MTAPFPYAELHCISNHSFLRGASHPEELVWRAHELGYRALAITDECSVAGVVKAWRVIDAHELPMTLIIGAEFRFEGQLVILLAPDMTGYSQLCQLITRARRRCEKGAYRVTEADFRQALDHCLCLWSPRHIDEDEASLLRFKDYFPERCWVLVENLLTNTGFEEARNSQRLGERCNVPAVCANNVHMHHPDRKNLQDALTAIRHNLTLHEAMPHLFPNAENHLRSFNKLRSLYTDEQRAETMRIAERCHFTLDELQYRYPKDVLPGQYTAPEYLRLLVYQGARRRFPEGLNEELETTIERELAMIRQKGYEHYFLTVYDIVRFARSQQILCQGRGSAANSVVCYCLGITEVNPKEASLLFDRFISAGRKEPPDIDVDFEHERREEVIQYLYRKYGRKRAALAATVITYKRKSALRDIGRVLGLNLDQLNQKIANYGWRYRSKNWIDEIIEDGMGLSDHQIGLFKSLLNQIHGFPRHLSQHVGGFVLTEGVVADLVPIENATMADRTVIQWDKDDLEAVGLMKVDVLGLGMLSAVRKTLDLVREHQGKTLKIQNIDRADADVFNMIQQADTVGVFQIESRAQMNMLPRLKPEKFYDLVVQVAIVRPGPIHGDMVHPYLKRRVGQEKVEYPNPALIPILERTLGVPIFQEQVISLAMTAADFTSEQANELRRSMASWKKTGHITQLRDQLTANMSANGYPDTFIQRINRQIEGFGEYGFPESHAAGFALIAYLSAWLKYHHPAAFCCALLNSLPMGFYSASQLVQDVQRHGVTALPIDINASDWDSSLEGDRDHPDIRLGFRRVKGLSEEAGRSLVQHRPEAGYRRIKELERLPDITTGDLDALASANAFQYLTEHRHQARWETSALRLQAPLLSDAFDETLPEQYALPAPDAWANLVEDYDSQGLSLGPHLIQLLRESRQIPNTHAANKLLDLAKVEQDRLTRLAQEQGLTLPDRVRVPIQVIGVIVNRQAPKTKTGVTFVTLEDDTGNINVVVWRRQALEFMRVLTTEQLVKVTGLLEKAWDNDVIHVIAESMDGVQAISSQEPRIASRDYH
ncbi:error-prone DNA polymerase [Saccharospirillum salsuginis]|uniref:Error-prone DNA polymerase n=1 Tax=Saccharospirillum salsuginis TaxID=418750 RepID=A0A918KRJ7_9GAMM|nr:error-prone DNA polymerase [Saccharospirillum salsuginis]GGX73238.1 error-prone DNA polymerase [Saccharospirillum salsuginis]